MIRKLKAWIIRKRFERVFSVPKPARAAKSHIRTSPTLSEARLQSRLHQALRGVR